MVSSVGLTISIIDAIATVATAIAATGSWMAARRTNKTASTVAAIEPVPGLLVTTELAHIWLAWQALTHKDSQLRAEQTRR